MKVEVGQQAPQFTLQTQDGKDWSLGDQAGAPVVLYFYPKDGSTGCAAQACDVRDHWSEFADLGVAVVGISPDDVESHRSFADKNALPHTLLADPERDVIQAYGAWGEKVREGKTIEGVLRSSVVVDGQGEVAAVFGSIEPKEQSEKSLRVVRDLMA